MKRARIRLGGRELDVVGREDGRLATADGAILESSAVEWLPPSTPLVLGLALNYADHAAELDFRKQPDHPILFIKNPTSLVGHRHPVVRPAGVAFMHYEGELGVVIGRPARRVARADALGHVGGYTVCNDFTVRDFVENFYRPPVKAKGFDTFGPIGPWVVDAADVPDPGALAVRTWVNGELRQDGNTRDLLFDVPTLIEYVSAFMTLPAGAIISTGTPRGISNVEPGDVVVVEVEGVGRLESPIVAEGEV
jgi:5-oxopent-3-ene-1,2,5-tricarboxylate decarboxylase / 2-hydroxyhepta-2,4-diene-1,7-dioate isomerase